MKGCHPTCKALGLFAMRVLIGGIFIYAGLNKLVWNHDMAAGMMTAKVGWLGGGSLWAYIVGGLEVLGGAMLILGVWSRYAATWLSVILLVAMFTVHRGSPQGVSGYFYPLAMLAGCFGLLGAGAGKWRLVKTECHCKGCKEAAAEGCGGSGACGGNACGCGKEKGHMSPQTATMPVADDGCCGGGCCSSGMEEKK